MPTGLQPPIELYVMHDQGRVAGRINHGRRPGEMAGKARAEERIGVGRNKVQDLFPVNLLARPHQLGLGDLMDRRLHGHWTSRL